MSTAASTTTRLRMSSDDRSADSEAAAAHEAQTDLATLVDRLRLDQEPFASAAAAEIGRRFYPLIRKFWRQQRCGEYADFYQDVMLRLFMALPQLRDYAAFPGLFRRIVIAAAADFWRRQGPHEENLTDVDVNSLERSFDHDLSAPVLVRTYLDWLPPREKEVIELSFMHDLDPEDIASRLGITAGAVRMTKARALQRLRTLIQKV